MSNGSNTPRAAKGRRTENRQWEKDTHYRDTIAPESAEMGMLAKQDALIDALNALPKTVELESDATAGGGATEAGLAVTGLKANDVITSVELTTEGAGGTVTADSWANQTDDALDVTFSADPGAGAIVTVTVLRKKEAADLLEKLKLM